MSTGTPVVVSRIQNRRGTQAQFDKLYPGEYTSGPGAVSESSIITVDSTDGLVVGARPQVINGTGEFASGTTIIAVNSITEFVVSSNPIIPLSGIDTVVYVPKYNGIGGAIGANILQPGEIALCVDTRRVFIGNTNGEYVEILTHSGGSSIVMTPFVITLQPVSVWTGILQLTYTPTPFHTMLYSVVDLATNDPNITGVNFAKSGQMQVTATNSVVSLVDTCTDINTAPLVPNPNPLLPDVHPDISFRATYDDDHNIKISYIHNFPTPVTFSTSSIIWAAI